MLVLLSTIGLKSDIFYVGSIASMVLSLILWFVPRGGSDQEKARAERLAVFVGLWPPTLFLMGHALQEHDKQT